MIRHIVSLRCRAGVPQAEKEAIYADLRGLAGHIEGILDFRSFRNQAVELPLVHGFHDMFWLDFRDAGVREVYLADPVHKAIGARVMAIAEGGPAGVYVCDIEM